MNHGGAPVCRRCGASVARPTDEIGRRRCRCHPGARVDGSFGGAALTTRYACCGFVPSHGLSDGGGCTRCDHTIVWPPPSAWPIPAYAAAADFALGADPGHHHADGVAERLAAAVRAAAVFAPAYYASLSIEEREHVARIEKKLLAAQAARASRGAAGVSWRPRPDESAPLPEAAVTAVAAAAPHAETQLVDALAGVPPGARADPAAVTRADAAALSSLPPVALVWLPSSQCHNFSS